MHAKQLQRRRVLICEFVARTLPWARVGGRRGAHLPFWLDLLEQNLLWVGYYFLLWKYQFSLRTQQALFKIAWRWLLQQYVMVQSEMYSFVTADCMP